jgi:hypothetical protein
MNDIKVIISLTSHDLRLKNDTTTKVIFQILRGTFKDLKVCLTLFKDDVKLIHPNLQQLIDIGLVELIVADKDLGPHLKYFYAMQKYRNLPVITIDDDIIYPTEMIENMVNAYNTHKCIIARRCYAITEGLDYYTWLNNGCSYSEEPTHKLFATGIGGILYPPDCLKISDANIDEILRIKYDDDFYLKALEVRHDIKIATYKMNRLYVKNLDDAYTQSCARWNENMNRANAGIALFINEFKKCLE